jgi:hypothetical protein
MEILIQSKHFRLFQDLLDEPLLTFEKNLLQPTISQQINLSQGNLLDGSIKMISPTFHSDGVKLSNEP